MPPKKNPLKLNKLQLKTLTLLQEIAHQPDYATADTDSGDVSITQLPHAHGNHFHIGDAVVMARDATGLQNQAVWVALERKGLVRTNFPENVTLTQAGVSYDTGLRDSILHGSDH